MVLLYDPLSNVSAVEQRQCASGHAAVVSFEGFFSAVCTHCGVFGSLVLTEMSSHGGPRLVLQWMDSTICKSLKMCFLFWFF